MARPVGLSRPLYAQIAVLLQNRILAGTYAPGSRLPGENELTEEFNVSRSTIRQALQELINKQYLSSRQGSGTYVPTSLPVEPLSPQTGPMYTGFLDDLKYESKNVLETHRKQSRIKATRKLSEELDVEIGSPLVRYSAVRHRDGQCYGYAEDILPLWAAKKISANILSYSSTVVDALSNSGQTIMESVQRLEPVVLKPHVSKLLEVEINTAAIEMKGIAYKKGHKPINSYSLLLPAGYGIGLHLVRLWGEDS